MTDTGTTTYPINVDNDDKFVASHTDNTVGSLICGTSSSVLVDDWDEIEDGSFRITVDGTTYNIDDIDFKATTINEDNITTEETTTSTEYHYPDNGLGQTFKTGLYTSKINSVSVYINVGTALGHGIITLKQTGIEGTVLGSKSFVHTLGTRWVTVTFDTPIDVLSNSTYAITLTSDSGTYVYWFGDSANSYSDGDAYDESGGWSIITDPYVFAMKVNETASAIRDMDDVANYLQTQLRTTTSGGEIVTWNTDKFTITSGTDGEDSEVKDMTTSTGTVGTDLSGEASPLWLNGKNGISTKGTSDVGKIVKLNSAGKLNSSFSNEENFGDGSDGDVIISTNTTLTEDMQYNNLTINAGMTLDTNGYIVRVKNNTINNGTIARNGNDGSDGVGSGTNLGQGGAGGAALSSNTVFGGYAGSGGGRAGNGHYPDGADGGNGLNSDPSLTNTNGSAGGAGGGGDAGAGGIGGTATQENYTLKDSVTKESNILDSEINISVLGQLMTNVIGFSSQVKLSNSASSGGGGGGEMDSGLGISSYAGGGGGAGSTGGIILLYSKNITNNSVFSTTGGDGGDGGDGNASHSYDIYPGGGGAGGAGGLIVLVYTSYIENGSINVSGGNKGVGGVSDPGSGADGGDGLDGKYIKIKV